MTASKQPAIVTIAERKVALRWSGRAKYRVGTVRPEPLIDDVKSGKAFAFLVAYVWAMLADEGDRRRWSMPEELAAAIDPQDALLLGELWKTMWREAFELDLDNLPTAATEQSSSQVQAESAAEAAVTT